MQKIRLVQVVVQPAFVIDDGTNLTPLEHPPLVVPGNEWADYPSRFMAEVAEWQAKIDNASEDNGIVAIGPVIREDL